MYFELVAFLHVDLDNVKEIYKIRVLAQKAPEVLERNLRELGEIEELEDRPRELDLGGLPILVRRGVVDERVEVLQVHEGKLALALARDDFEDEAELGLEGAFEEEDDELEVVLEGDLLAFVGFDEREDSRDHRVRGFELG